MGVPPTTIIDDAEMFDALEDAAVRQATRWTNSDELLASILEMLHAIYLLTAKANGAKNVGTPLKVKRPHQKVVKPTAISPREFAQQTRSNRGK